ncbi:MAG TPA: BNR-4 repeat-containing protein, partial [Azospirillaceae bacterium]|nr:BNR-4 repeat-containing protein [Azospirillaceae bacterium]
ASIAVDRDGYIHVAYNMHNMPWQYAVSEKPGDISRFVFKGQRLTQADLDTVKHENKTVFPRLNSGAIPGNQITYPAFFTDRAGELYVTYRFALRPKRTYIERTLAAGIARYDRARKKWSAIGGPIPVGSSDADLPAGTRVAQAWPFAYNHTLTVYPPRLWFDRNNGMHATWVWRNGGAGIDATRPTYAYSPDGGHTFYRSDGRRYPPAIALKDVEILPYVFYGRFFTMTAVTANRAGRVTFGLQPVDGTGIRITHVPGGSWTSPETAPLNAGAPFVDDADREWSIATGPVILRRAGNAVPGSRWTEVYRDTGWCLPKVLPWPGERAFLVHLQACDNTTVKIIKVTAP